MPFSLKARVVWSILKNMGIRYFLFRASYELKRKTGLLKKKFPVNPKLKSYINIDKWRSNSTSFFFSDKRQLQLKAYPDLQLQKEVEEIFKGNLLLFNSIPAELGSDYDWITHPLNKFRYDKNKHWTEIEDFSKEAGDIKYVWEKSRFSYLYTVIRYDYHFNKDCSRFVFDEIKNWLQANPINSGPNYRCSQEISLRVFNWIFALHYYKDSYQLTDELFHKIMNAIYWQMHHVYNNINFSRIAVRNNHALTETLALYIVGMMFPEFPGSKKWKEQGKKWFEEEIAYQVYEDGSYLQFSMNYERVVIQLMSWAFYLAEANGEYFSDSTYDRAYSALTFMYTCQDRNTGMLPNYGANDGALFFKLNSLLYRDYRPQLNALYYFFHKKHLYKDLSTWEDVSWYSTFLNDRSERPDYLKKISMSVIDVGIIPRYNVFDKGGYMVVNEGDMLSFMRSGSHVDRPSQADNLHLDLWYKGENIMRDAGTYMYNTDEAEVRFFNGTASHNTVMLGDHDQMLKGPRFIWTNWTQGKECRLIVEETEYKMSGKISAFAHLTCNGVIHSREVIKKKDIPHWVITDQFSGNVNLPLKQIWNPSETFMNRFTIMAEDQEGKEIEPLYQEGWYSSYYGLKEKTKQIIFITNGLSITTIISLKLKA